MTLTLEKAQRLKQDLLDFTFDAEGEIAVALEEYSAAQLAQLVDSSYQGNQKTELVIDSFATEGTVGDQSILDYFLENRPNLSLEDQALVSRWSQGFVGLFAVRERALEHLVLMNWLTEKQYKVLIPKEPQDRNIARLKTGEIVLTRLLPLGKNWMLSGPSIFLGKLGKPKLAVAIGNFKKYHKNYLYGDAPDLLEEAWQSVESYHQAFVDYFGSHEITLTGHQLEKELADFQAHMTQQKLAALDLDGEKSIGELADEAGVTREEMVETAAAMGVDEKTTSRLLAKQSVSKMMQPTTELPKHLKSAAQVTVLTHPRWGQVMVATYQPLIDALEAGNQTSIPDSDALVQQCLKNLEIKPFVWHQLAQKYPSPLEKMLQNTLDLPRLSLKEDLATILINFGHPEKPDLPETASVPVHLHNLFQEALLEVNRSQSSKSKGKGKPQKKVGFG
ncbi:hypothetical protein [Acaryochloris sp. CCMEE 5410]|uniref:hypothetical protein n=1 Tax=Acaryochloris sp. CCMEE 5410 TaxID=310037 RepID=UPI0002484EC4|nr:hypothetical protein [Acaryochloris sp. CCMEE 5410]KAI9132282.1 hypothetical protein ON05_002065 [Acaryochloris sp. CCMEE 5410]